jgi:outer membrane lipoprotein-sorting protein
MGIRTHIWLVVVMIGGILAACAPGQQPTADDIVARLEEAEAQIRDYHGIVETTLTEPGSGPTTYRQEVWTRGPDLLRVEIQEGPAEMVGQVIVYNAERVWFYDPHLNQVQILPVQAPFRLPLREMEPAMWATAKEMLGDSTAKYLAAETVTGRRAHKVQLVPRSGTDLFAALGGEPMTVWVDQEHARRLRMELPLADGRHYTMVYRLLEVNAGVPDSLFAFTSPPGAVSITKEVAVTAPAVNEMGLAEARGSAAFPLLLPSHLPAAMEFSQARVVTGGGSVSLIYRGDDGNLTITEGLATPDVSLPDLGEQISLRGTTARLQRQGERSISLSWQEAGLVIFLSGAVSEDEALEIARSME